jgi:cytochrome P450
VITTRQRAARYPFDSSGPALETCPEYTSLRAREPVCRVELPYGGPAWLVTTFAEAATVLSDPRFSRSATLGRDLPRESPRPAVQGSMVAADPPVHTRLRNLVSRAFTPGRVEQLRPQLKKRSAGLLAAMSASGKPADLVRYYTARLPVEVTCDLLGIAEADREPMRSWKDGVVSVSALSEPEQLRIYGEIATYVSNLIEQRRRHPGDDLISALIAARDGGDKLTERELLELTIIVVVSGNDTTANQLANYAYMLLTHQAHWRQLVNDPDLIPSAVEELARFIPFSSGILQPRAAITDVELGGQLIRAGDVMLIALDSANRDEKVFRDGDELLFDRQPNSHLGYGHGPHYCLGASLARRELQIAVHHWTTQYPGLRLAIPAADVRWKTGLILRGPVELPVTW